MSELTPVVESRVAQSVGSLIDELYDLNQQKKELNQKLEDLKHEAAEVEQLIFAALDHEDLTQCRGRVGKVTITVSDVPTVVDWDRFQEYILQTRALHLLERRPAVMAWRELHQSGEVVPGVNPFTKRSLSVRKA
jgi:hypothetical protein